MCGRFYVDPDDMSDAELIALLDREKLKVEQAEDESQLTFGEVRPGDCAAVLAMNRKHQRSAFVMKWGFRLDKQLIFNARGETAASKSMFRQSALERRCLVPASAYFEWDHRQKPYQKLRFAAPERELIYLAGLYRFEQNASLPVFTILTCEAAPEIACFHDRMPVIIPPEMANEWLDRAQSFDKLLMHAEAELNWRAAI